MNISPSPRVISLPESYILTKGQGLKLRDGRNALIFAYGPVMLNEALLASEILSESGYGLEVINMPWLNTVDIKWLEKVTMCHDQIFVIEDHSRYGGLGEFLMFKLTDANLLEHNNFTVFAIDGFPACGSPAEALNFHGLDGQSLAKRIKTMNHVKQH